VLGSDEQLQRVRARDKGTGGRSAGHAAWGGIQDSGACQRRARAKRKARSEGKGPPQELASRGQIPALRKKELA
jgi:hypothetical protein